MVKLVVVGCQGRMGTMVVDCIKTVDEFDYLGGVTSSDSLTQALSKMSPDVVIDLTNPSVVFDHATTYLTHQIPSIIGTTGLSQPEIVKLTGQAKSQQLGMMILPNFSIAMALLQKCVALVSPYFDKAEIIESHHPQKITCNDQDCLSFCK